MKNSVLVLCVCACIGTLTVALPQQQPGFPAGNGPVFATTSASAPNASPGAASTTATPNASPGAASTTAAPTTPLATPQFFACMQACPATSEYNPVCGTDSQNYHNAARLDCAARCGRNVAAVRQGTCLPL